MNQRAAGIPVVGEASDALRRGAAPRGGRTREPYPVAPESPNA
jgi:hypothetical protein